MATKAQAQKQKATRIHISVKPEPKQVLDELAVEHIGNYSQAVGVLLIAEGRRRKAGRKGK